MNFFSIRNVIFFLISAIIVFSALIFIGDYGKVMLSFDMIRPEIIAAILSLALANYLFRYLKWEYFLRISKIRLPVKISVLVFLSGLSMAITPAKIGELLKSYYLKKLRGIRMRRTVMIIISERLTDVLGLSILSLLGLASFLDQAYLLVGLLVMVFAAIFILTNEKVFLRLCKFSSRIPYVKKYSKDMIAIYKSSKILLSFRSLSVATVISIVSWFFECLALYLLLTSLGVPISILAATFIFSFSSIFGSVLVLPGGMGAAEGSFMALLILLGVSVTIASLSTIVIRIFTLFFGVFIGAIALALTNRLLKTRRHSS
jgi:glycosyltransferase 2 family protein